MLNQSISRDYYKLASYAAGANINHNDAADLNSELLFTGGLMLLPLGLQGGKAVFWQGPKWILQNKGNYTSAWQTHKANNQASKNALKYLKGNNIFETINNRSYYNNLLELEKKVPVKPDYSQWATLKKESQRKKYFNNGKKAAYYDEVKKLIEEAKTKKLTGKALKEHLKKVDEALAKADLRVKEAINSGLIKPATKRGKIWSGIKKYSGYDAVDTALKKGATSSNKAVKALSKGAKGGGLATAAIGLAIETPELIETYKTCGAAKGTKQLAKTTAVVAAEGAGYAIGAKVGGIAGAKIGAAVGTCIGGPVGTAVGAAVGGIIGVCTGVLGSWLAGKGVKELLGKSELEKHKQAEAQKLVKAAKESEEGKAQLLAKVEEKAQNDGGCNDENIIKVYEKIAQERENSISEETNPEIYSPVTDSSNTAQTDDFSNTINMLNSIAANCNLQQQNFMNPFSNLGYI